MSAALPSRSTLVRRLAFAFAAHLVLFAITLGVVLHATVQLDTADADVGRFERAKDSGHRVSALVREQYIHQAHTIIEGNRSHVGHYEDIARKTREAIASLERIVEDPADRAEVEVIASLVKKNDDEFHTETLPAIDGDSDVRVRELHAQTEAVVVSALRKIGAINARFEKRTVEARARADVLRKRTRTTALVCFALASVLAGLGAIFTTRWIATRVRLLRNGTRAIGRGDLQTRIPIDGKDEFAEIARDVEEMASSLQRHHDEMLRAQRLASIGQIAAGVAHEINNPLGVILGFVKTMRRSVARDDEGLDVVEAEATQCRRIVEGLLDLARPPSLAMENVDLVKLLEETIARLRARGGLDNVTIVGPSGPKVMTTIDPGRFRQVVLNVLTNAVDATRPNGEVRIWVNEAKAHVEIAVHDDGSGIPAEVRDRLFEPFVTTKKEGLGLGLAIANAIVDAHCGTIRCESPADGGTVVRILLPRKAIEGAA